LSIIYLSKKITNAFEITKHNKKVKRTI